MDLETFVVETLCQIRAGLIKAQENGVKVLTSVRVAKRVEFDVAVTTTEAMGKKGSAGISVLSAIKGGTQSESSTASSFVSRIKFSVPIFYPEISK